MKNKVLATLMSVCLFAGLAVPAFAITTSTQSGQNSDIKTGEFLKTEYTLKNSKTKEMDAELRAYVSTKQLTQNPDIQWSIENDENFAFSISEGGVVSAVEDKGTATIIASMNDGTVLAKTKIKAEPKPKEINATGYTFENSTETMLIGPQAVLIDNDGDTAGVDGIQTIKIKPSPKDSKFTNAQQNAIKDAIEASDSPLKIKVGSNTFVTGTVATSEDEVVVSYDPSVMTPGNTTYTVAGNPTAGDTLKIAGVTYTVAAPLTLDNVVAGFIARWDATASEANKAKWVVTPGASGSGAIIFTDTAIGANTSPDAAPVYTKTGLSTATVAVANTTSTFTSFSDVSGEKLDKQVLELSVKFPRPNNDDPSAGSTIKRSVNVYGKKAVAANSINAAATKTIGVGEVLNVVNLFKQGPSSANITFDVKYNYDYVDQNAEYSDYAIVLDSSDAEYKDAGDVLGVAVGRNKITAEIQTPFGLKTASFVVNVVEKGKNPTTPDAGDAALSFSVGSTAVGGAGFTITLKNAPEGAAVTYKSLDEKIATVDASGKVTGVSAGTTKIEVNVNGTKLYCTVTVKAAAGGNTGTGTIPPATGVAVLAPLF